MASRFPVRAFVLLTLALWLSGSIASFGQAPTLEPLWPGVTYDPAIPTLEAVVGHQPGLEITTPEDIGRYLRALADAAPDRTRLVQYATSYEGRPLWLMVIGSPERMARLDAVKADIQKLGDPRGLSTAEADALVRDLPVVVWFVHGVHGNEISSSDAALQEAYHLLAARGDAGLDQVRRDALVLIDPMQNPDGRARFVFQNLQGRAFPPDPTPYSASHDEPWPGGRSNHYLFDMNRDWFAQTQPESRGRVAVGRQYWPQVTVDLHEQGGDNTYYFNPPADPVNPFITKSQIAGWELFGRANADRFDARGWPYFIREVYDAFYPGYGDSWPTFQGSIGMTYEQASARSLAFRKSDGTIMTYRDGVMHHMNAALTTAITAARNRERLVRDFLEYRRSAVTEGEKSPAREYVLVPGTDPSRADRLARNLATQGIEVRRTEEAITVGGRQLPAGTYLVSHAQPSGRLITNLLERHIGQPEDFIERQEERRARRQPDQIYDITAWSLPLLWDVEVLASPSAITARATAVPSTWDAALPSATLPEARVGYLMPWGTGAAELAEAALRQGIRMHSIGGPFRLGGRDYPIGTVFFRNAGNPGDLHARLAALQSAHAAELVPIDSTYTESGTSLGSDDTMFVKAPRVLMAWDTPTSSLSAGWARYVLEQRFGQPVTAVRTSSLARATLADFDVVVLPSGNYNGEIGEAMVTRLKDWIRGGGTLITIAEATRWATGSNVGLLATTPLLKNGKPDVPPQGNGGGAGGQGNTTPADFDYDASIQPDRERPASQPGAILNVTLETDHWLTAGHDAQMQTMVEGNRVFAPIKLDSGRNVGIYAKKESLIASGLVWPEGQDLLVQKAYLMHQPMGRGHVIAFAEDPNYRGFSEGSMLLFMNAVLLGPAY
ncbi:MAG: M14 metallopeptidase family protein [Vicinamibacterales bacterium]